MCIAIPMRLLKIEGVTGLVEVDGITRRVNLMLIDSPEVGDYLIIHAGCAINRIDEETAKETIDTLKGLLNESLNPDSTPDSGLPQIKG